MRTVPAAPEALIVTAPAPDSVAVKR